MTQFPTRRTVIADIIQNAKLLMAGRFLSMSFTKRFSTPNETSERSITGLGAAADAYVRLDPEYRDGGE